MESKEESFGIIPLRRTDEGWRVFIILHKQGNHWAFPKGGAEPGEGAHDSARRELQEETGLKVEEFFIGEPFIETYTFYRNKGKVEKTVTYFPAIVSEAFLLQPDEIRDGKWVTFEEAKEILTFEEAKKLCGRIEEIVNLKS